MRLDEIQPSQLYISQGKLSRVMEAFESGKPNSLELIPIKKLNGETIMTDGHTRALAWFLHGYREVPVEWETIEWDWEAYNICVNWCKEEGINEIADLKDRVIDDENYQVLWLDRCKKMHEEIEEKRHRKN